MGADKPEIEASESAIQDDRDKDGEGAEARKISRFERLKKSLRGFKEETPTFIHCGDVSSGGPGKDSFRVFTGANRKSRRSDAFPLKTTDTTLDPTSRLKMLDH
jgi:hypothetical protein